jgi:hypothetical protein
LYIRRKLFKLPHISLSCTNTNVNPTAPFPPLPPPSTTTHIVLCSLTLKHQPHPQPPPHNHHPDSTNPTNTNLNPTTPFPPLPPPSTTTPIYDHLHRSLFPYAQTPTPPTTTTAQPPPRQHQPRNHRPTTDNTNPSITKSKVAKPEAPVSHKTMKLMLRAVNIMEHAQTSTKQERKEAHRCVHYLVHSQVAAAAESGKILACARSRRCMVLLQTGLLAGSGGVACVEEHASEIWVLVTPKVHDTLLPSIQKTRRLRIKN